MDSLSQIKETAAQWVARRHGAQWSDTDEAALSEWLGASPGHRVEYLCHEKTWREANRLKVLGAGRRPGIIPTLDDWRASAYFKYIRPINSGSTRSHLQRVRSSKKYLAFAAGVLLACAAGYSAWHSWSGDRYSTSIGITTAVPLPDGSKITLNTDSEIRIAVTEHQREVELAQGEAFFEVVRDPSRPFVVHAGGKRIDVLGTKFSVLRAGRDVRVVVTEGQVRIDRIRVSAGSVARTRGGTVIVQPQNLPQAEQLLSWRDGYLMFDEVTLADAVAEFNRYNARKLVIEDSTVANIPVTGHFRSTNVESFATLLERGFSVAVIRENDRIVLVRAR
jgi:transmembrane sensor